jgi:hypothetical protein
VRAAAAVVAPADLEGIARSPIAGVGFFKDVPRR